jgi:sulfoxide reductase catalytic subunit YedY
MKQNNLGSVPIKSSEITPEHLYLSRRKFMKLVGMVGVTAALAACSPGALPSPTQNQPTPTDLNTSTKTTDLNTSTKTNDLNAPLTSYEAVTNYNNYYEFDLGKEGIGTLSKNFKTSPWQIEVSGMVNKPMTIGLEDILKNYTQEERVYRLRCVEGWSMVIPWTGFQLSDILKQVEPSSEARFVAFETILAPDQMPGQKNPMFPWPYTEGLRLDEAMHPLTILATGMYGKPLPNQNGSPIRLVVPWKYGFKSIKAIVRIKLVADQPKTLWESVAPDEYGFYSNVNPQRPHPRWSQSSERLIGEGTRRPTLMFNGYEKEVASLYTGMDLFKNY